MADIIKVSPEKLRATASEFDSLGGNVRNLPSQMMTTVTGLGAQWQGEAATAYINKFKGLEDDIQRMCNMITEHSRDLQDMAAAYERSDADNMADANSLLDNVIE